VASAVFAESGIDERGNPPPFVEQKSGQQRVAVVGAVS
jgi:hypothetical protein